MKEEFDGYWHWYFSDFCDDIILNNITGKFLFFDVNFELLKKIAKNEIDNHGFHEAKINDMISRGNEFVLCLYDVNDNRKHELNERNNSEYHSKYRYWKFDTDIMNNKYSDLYKNMKKKGG